MQKSELNYKNNNEIDLKKVINIFLKKKMLIIAITSLFFILSFAYALYLPNIYKSKALLLSPNTIPSLTTKLGSYSALSGISSGLINSGDNNLSDEAIARINSLDFFTNHFLPFIQLQDLYASKKWNKDQNKIIYNDSLFNSKTNQWVGEFNKKAPSNQEAYLIYRDIIQISKDSQTSFVSISIEHVSPYLAKEWLDLVIEKINETMRENDRKDAQAYINFLNEASKKNNPAEIKQAISNSLEEQMKNLVMASVKKDYVFKIISSPVVSEIKSSPQRLIIVLLGLIMGFFSSLFLSLFISLYKENE